ncbi:MAG: hypothetical protein JO128_08030 [Alphaproteobacteria bacterium]|nr:hypothetical protein [Alphaproteobacteria bacterium]
MMGEARRMRIAASSLSRAKRELIAAADRMEETLPRFDHAKGRLLAERDRACKIAREAADVRRRILQSSPGNLAPLLA